MEKRHLYYHVAHVWNITFHDNNVHMQSVKMYGRVKYKLERQVGTSREFMRRNSFLCERPPRTCPSPFQRLFFSLDSIIIQSGSPQTLWIKIPGHFQGRFLAADAHGMKTIVVKK